MCTYNPASPMCADCPHLGDCIDEHTQGHTEESREGPLRIIKPRCRSRRRRKP